MFDLSIKTPQALLHRNHGRKNHIKNRPLAKNACVVRCTWLTVQKKLHLHFQEEERLRDNYIRLKILRNYGTPKVLNVSRNVVKELHNLRCAVNSMVRITLTKLLHSQTRTICNNLLTSCNRLVGTSRYQDGLAWLATAC